MVDLAGEQKKMPENLSGGMRKRVGLARTIVVRPACILYDEPTTGLDPIATDSINHLIRRLQKRLAVTSVVVTHDMKTAFHTADQIAFLNEGRIYFNGTADSSAPRPIRSSRTSSRAAPATPTSRLFLSHEHRTQRRRSFSSACFS